MAQRFVNIRIILQKPPSPLRRAYCSGSSIEGHLVAELIAPICVERISVHFSGKGEVKCTPINAATRCDQFHLGDEVYCDETQILAGQADRRIGQSECLTLPAGRHSLPFRFNIPASAPSSIEGEFGFIRYDLQGVVTMADQTHCCTKPLAIAVHHPVSVAEPHLLVPKRQEVQKTVSSYFFWTSSPIVLTVAVPKTGYCIGEEIPLKVSIENGSRRRVFLTASVNEQVVYSSQGATPVTNYSEQTVVRVKSGAMASNSTHEWNPTIKIPAFSVENTHTSRLIQVSYSLSVTAAVSQSHSEHNLSASIPLTLGYQQYAVTTSTPLAANIPSINVWAPQSGQHSRTSTSGAKLHDPPPYSPQTHSGLPSYGEAVSQRPHNAYM